MKKDNENYITVKVNRFDWLEFKLWQEERISKRNVFIGGMIVGAIVLILLKILLDTVFLWV